MLSGRRRSARPIRKSSAETEPDRSAVDLRAAEGAVVAARHLPGDLRPRPGLDRPRRFGRRPCRSRSRPRRPHQTLIVQSRLRVVASVVANPRRDSASSQSATLWSSRKMRVTCASVRRGSGGRRAARSSGVVVTARRPRRGRGGRRGAAVARSDRGEDAARARERASRCRRQRYQRRAERPELVADEVQRRDQDDRDRLGHDLVQPERDEAGQQERGSRASATTEHDQEAEPLLADVAALVMERPEPVPGVVVRDRDEERAGGCG